MRDEDRTVLQGHIRKVFDPLVNSFTSADDVAHAAQLFLQAVHATLSEVQHKWNNKYSNIIKILPDDTLVLCFSWLPYKDLIRAACVSRTWRTLALHNTSLWTNIDLRNGSDQLNSSMLANLFSRSAQPLNVQLGITQHKAFKLVSPYIHRMRSLECYSLPSSCLAGLSAPNLERLVVGTIAHLPDAPCLRYLRVTGFEFRVEPLVPPFLLMEEFIGDMTCVSKESDARALFRLFPNLTRLTLSNIIFGNQKYLPQPPFPPNLTHITLNSYFSLDEYLQCLHQHTALQYLEVDDECFDPGMAVLLSRGRPICSASISYASISLECSNFTFRSIWTVTPKWAELARKLSPHLLAIQELDIERCAEFFTTLLLELPGLPVLHSLSLDEPDALFSPGITLSAHRLRSLTITVPENYTDDQTKALLDYALVILPTVWGQKFTVPRLEELIIDGIDKQNFDTYDTAPILSVVDNVYCGYCQISA